MSAKAGPNTTHQLPILAVGLAIHTMTGNGTFETFADPAAMQQVSVFQPTVRYLQRLEILGPMAALGKLVDCLARAAKARFPPLASNAALRPNVKEGLHVNPGAILDHGNGWLI